MGSRRAKAPNVRNYAVTREQWDKMLAAYRQHPTIRTVMAAGGVGKRIARRAVMEGWPDLSLPPFVELLSSGSSVHKEMAVQRDSWHEAAITQGEAARQAAEEAMAARISMKSALQSARLAQTLAGKLLERFDRGEVDLPDVVTPKVVHDILKSLESSTKIVEKAIRIEQLQMGRPEAVLGVEIGILLERCNDDELEGVVETGEVPSRILDQRKRVLDAVSDQDEVDPDALDDSQEAQDTPSAPPDALEPPVARPVPKEPRERLSVRLAIGARE